MRSMRRSAAAVLLAACTPTERPVADTAVAAAPATSATPAAGRFTAADFAHLRWIDGSWRGRLPTGGYFYERYQVLDDSTIASHSFGDSTFTAVTDSARIVLRAGTVADEGGRARWEATRLDASGVDFAPVRGASNRFTWTREANDRWTATLRSTDREGREQVTIYPMERVVR